METPTSSRRIIRSQVPISSCKNEESGKEVIKSRSALIDITNDSPIVGLAVGNMKTPSSTFYSKRMIVREGEEDESKHAKTPGSGEALLRDQVQSLLQKVEEEALIKKITFEPRNFGNSLMYILAPTPANTPQVYENNNNGSESLTVSPVGSESFNFSQKLDQQEEPEEALEKNVITKLLFTEKLEGYDSSLDDEDDGSVWSIQVNASTSDEHEDDEEFEVDELCELMINICVDGDGDKFKGGFGCDHDDGELEVDD